MNANAPPFVRRGVQESDSWGDCHEDTTFVRAFYSGQQRRAGYQERYSPWKWCPTSPEEPFKKDICSHLEDVLSSCCASALSGMRRARAKIHSAVANSKEAPLSATALRKLRHGIRPGDARLFSNVRFRSEKAENQKTFFEYVIHEEPRNMKWDQCLKVGVLVELSSEMFSETSLFVGGKIVNSIIDNDQNRIVSVEIINDVNLSYAQDQQATFCMLVSTTYYEPVRRALKRLHEHLNLNGATIPLQEELLSGKSCNSPAYLKQNPLSSISKAASRQGCAQVNEALHQHVGTHSLAIVLEHTTASETSTSTQIIQKLQHRDDGGAPIIVICASNAKVNKLISEVALFEKNIARLGRTSSNSEILLDTFAFEHSPRHHEHNRLEKQIHSQKQLLSFLLNATSELTAADAPQATFDTILSACPDELQCAVKFSSEELERQFNEDQQEIEVLLLSKKKQLEDLQKFDCQPPHGLDDEQRVLHCLEAEAQKKVLQDEFDSTCEKILEQTQQLTERENRHITIPSLHRCVMRCFHNNLIDFSALDNYDATTETLSRDCYALIGIINSCRAFGCTTSDLRVDIFWWLCCIAVRQTKLNLHNLNLRFNDVVIHHSKSIADALGNKSVIFATPASAAMYIDAIQSIKSEVVLVEEADILCEWQVLPCLPNSIQHLILVSQEMNLDRNYHRSESMLERLKRIGALIFKTSACSFKLKCGHQCGSPKEFCCGSTVWYEHWPCVICPVSQRTDVKKSSEKAIKSLMLLARKLCDGAPLNVYQKKVWIDHLDQYAHVVKLLLAPNANWKPKHRQQLFLKLNNLERQIVLIDTYLGDPGPKNILQTFIAHFKYLVRWKDTLDAIEIKVMRYRVDAIQNLSRYLFTIRLNKATVSDQFSCLLQRVLQTPPCDVQTFSDLASDARMLVIQPLLEKAAEALRNSNEFPDLQLKFVPSKYLPRCRALRRFVEVVGPDLECITDVVEIAFHGTPKKNFKFIFRNGFNVNCSWRCPDGRGIYFSKSPYDASDYSVNFNFVIVSAMLREKVKDVGRSVLVGGNSRYLLPLGVVKVPTA